MTGYHQEAQRTGSPRTYRLAADVYRAYLSAFARDADAEWTSDHAFNMSFYAAETAWGMGDWRVAAEQYERVVDFRIPDRATAREVSDERYRATAAYDAVLAWDRVVDAEHGHAQAAPSRGDAKQKGGLRARAVTASTTTSPLTEAEQRLVAACDRYADRFPDAKDALDIRYQAAVVFLERGQTPAALERFSKLVALAPDSDRARQAADLTLNVLETKGDWLALNAKAQEYARNGALARPGTDFAKRVTKVAEASRYAWVSEVVHKQQHQDARAAEEFLRFADDYPRSDHAAQALTYAMALLEQQGQLQRAVEVGHRALTRYPDTPLRLKLAHGLADLSAQLGDFRQAAEASEAFVTHMIAPAPARTARASSRLCSRRPPAGWRPRRARRVSTGRRWGRPTAPSLRTRPISAASRNGRMPRRWRWRWAACRRSGRLTAAAQAYEKAETLVPQSAAPRRFEALGLQLKAWRKAKQASRVKAVQQRVRQLWAGLGPRPGRIPRSCRPTPSWCSTMPNPCSISTAASTSPARPRCRPTSPGNGPRSRRSSRPTSGVISTGDGRSGIAALTRIGEAYADFATKIRLAPTPKELAEEDRASTATSWSRSRPLWSSGRWTRCRRAWRRPTSSASTPTGRSGRRTT